MNHITLPRRPLLSGLYHVVRLDTDRVQIVNGGRPVILAGEGIADLILPMLSMLNGETELDELRALFPDLVADVLTSLAGKGLLVEADPSKECAGASPTLAALALGAEPAEAVARLSGASVAIAGCGPPGITAAIALGKAGVGRLLVADSEVASSRDIAVAPHLFPEMQGRPRVDLARDLCLKATDALTTGASRPLHEDLLSEVDLVLIEVGYERDGSGFREVEVCLAAGCRCLPYTQDALEATIGPLIRPGGEPCHHCLEARRRSHLLSNEEDSAYYRHRGQFAPSPDFFLAAHSAILAGALAAEALRGVLESEAITDKAALVIDLSALTIRRESILPVPGCSGCSDAQSPR